MQDAGLLASLLQPWSALIQAYFPRLSGWGVAWR